MNGAARWLRNVGTEGKRGCDRDWFQVSREGDAVGEAAVIVSRINRGKGGYAALLSGCKDWFSRW